MNALFVIKNQITSQYISRKGGWTELITEARQFMTQEDANGWKPNDNEDIKVVKWDFEGYAKADELIEGIHTKKVEGMDMYHKRDVLVAMKEYADLKIRETLRLIASEISKKKFKTIIPMGTGRIEVNFVDIITSEEIEDLNLKYILL